MACSSTEVTYTSPDNARIPDKLTEGVAALSGRCTSAGGLKPRTVSGLLPPVEEDSDVNEDSEARAPALHAR